MNDRNILTNKSVLYIVAVTPTQDFDVVVRFIYQHAWYNTTYVNMINGKVKDYCLLIKSCGY